MSRARSRCSQDVMAGRRGFAGGARSTGPTRALPRADAHTPAFSRAVDLYTLPSRAPATHSSFLTAKKCRHVEARAEIDLDVLVGMSRRIARRGRGGEWKVGERTASERQTRDGEPIDAADGGRGTRLQSDVLGTHSRMIRVHRHV